MEKLVPTLTDVTSILQLACWVLTWFTQQIKPHFILQINYHLNELHEREWGKISTQSLKSICTILSLSLRESSVLCLQTFNATKFEKKWAKMECLRETKGKEKLSFDSLSLLLIILIEVSTKTFKFCKYLHITMFLYKILQMVPKMFHLFWLFASKKLSCDCERWAFKRHTIY